MTIDEWAVIYREALPPQLRPRMGDERFLVAAEDAMRNGWAARQAAIAVAGGRNYAGARNPVYLALIRLEDLAATRAGARPTRKEPEPHGCAFGWIDSQSGETTEPCPVCRPQLASRLALIPPPGERSQADYAFLRHREEVM
jgi:hypothetical protein